MVAANFEALMDSPFVTYFVMSFNRLPFLKNLLTSFHLCNVHPDYEWIITDYDSKDGSKEYLNDVAKQDKHFIIRHENENEYFDYLKSLGMGPKSKNQRVSSIGSRCRNETRKLAKGDLFFDIADDYQFIRKGNWVMAALSIYKDRVSVTGKDDTTSISMRAFMLSRLFKKNNTRSRAFKTKEGIEYFVFDQKGYDVYSIMKRSTAQKMGPYLEIDQLTDPKDVQAWKEDSLFFDFYTDYVKKAKQLSLKRIGMKYPYLVEFPNSIIPKLDPNTKPLFTPLFEEGEMEKKFSNSPHPVSSDEIFLAKGIKGIKTPIGDFQRNCYVGMKTLAHQVKSRVLTLKN